MGWEPPLRWAIRLNNVAASLGHGLTVMHQVLDDLRLSNLGLLVLGDDSLQDGQSLSELTLPCQARSLLLQPRGIRLVEERVVRARVRFRVRG